MLPNFLIIGAQKSATTFIHMCLAEHPEIYMPSQEISYFENPYYYQIPRAQFEKIFIDAYNKKALGIKRPTYLAKPECPKRIKDIIPHAKIIAILRNPIERVVSAYFHYINYGFISLKPIEKGMPELLGGRYRKKYPRAEEIIEFSFYYKNLKRYFDLFNKEQLLILFYKNIMKDKLQQVQNIYRFLKVDNSYIPTRLQSQPQAVIYSLPRIKILRLRNKHLYTYNKDKTRLYSKTQNYLDKKICRMIDTFDASFLSSWFNNQKPILSRELRQRLYEIYAQDIQNLEELLHVELSHWKSF